MIGTIDMKNNKQNYLCYSIYSYVSNDSLRGDKKAEYDTLIFSH